MNKPKKKRVVKESKTGLEINITREHCNIAKRRSSTECVIAQALADQFGEAAERFQVGARVTKIFFPDTVIKFSTPPVLRNGLRTFDNTGRWELPLGSFRLLPLTKSLTREAKAAKNALDRDPNRKRPMDGSRVAARRIRSLPTRDSKTLPLAQ